MKILITGSEGFIGKATTKRCRELGHEILGLDKKGELSLKIDLVDWSAQQLAYLLQGRDCVIHFAAQVDVRRSMENPSYDAENNIQATLKLLDACVKANVKRFIFASSGGAIADGNPQSPYGIAKLTIEKYLDFYSRRYNLEVVVLRYSNVYGPQQTSGIIPAIIKATQSNAPLRINGDGLQTRDYVYIDDVVEANILALTCPSGLYTVSTGIGTSLLDLSEKSPHTLSLVHVPAIPGEVRDSVLTPCGPPGWNPSISLEEGLQRTFEYYKTIY